MNFETAFQRAWGRPPTRAEVASVERVCNAFEVRDNDALKAIAGVLEYYHTHLRAYPRQCTTAVQQWLGSPDGAAALARALGSANSSGEPPSSGSANVSPRVATHGFNPPAAWMGLGGLALASSVLSGTLGMLAGTALSGRQPCWVPRGAADLITLSLLGAPTGWILLLPLAVAAYFGAVWGWRRGVDPNRPMGARALGWVVATTTTAAVLSWGVLVTRLMIRG